MIMLLSACKSGPSQQELFEKATVAQEKSDFAGAIGAYQEFVERYPDAPDAPKCQFMIGYLRANHMNDDTSAKEAYRQFIQMYPDHVLIKDAQWELDHLGMDVNEIEELNEILGKEADSTTTATDSIAG
jgi:outer membrane protein assembly factor BamD (BamD/ComL family)